MYASCLCLHVVVRMCVSKSAYPSYTKWMACSKSLRNNNNVPFTTGGSPRWVARRTFAPLLLLPWAHPDHWADHVRDPQGSILNHSHQCGLQFRTSMGRRRTRKYLPWFVMTTAISASTSPKGGDGITSETRRHRIGRRDLMSSAISETSITRDSWY